MKIGIRFARLLAAVGLVLGATAAWGAETTSVDVAKKTVAAFGEIVTAKATYDASVSIKGTGGEFSLNVPIALVYARPNRYRLEASSDIVHITAVSNGKKVWTYYPDLKQVEITDAPLIGVATPEGLTKLKGTVAMVLAYLATNSQMEGTSKLGERETYVVNISLPNQIAAKAWVSTADFQLYKLEITGDIANLAPLGKAAPGLKSGILAKSDQKATAKLTLETTSLALNQEIIDSVFDFVVPEGAKVIDKSKPIVKDVPVTPAIVPAEPAPAK